MRYLHHAVDPANSNPSEVHSSQGLTFPSGDSNRAASSIFDSIEGGEVSVPFKAALCVESAFQDPSIGPGSAVVPTSAPVKHRLLKMVRRPTLLHIPVTLSAKKTNAFICQASKLRNGPLTTPLWRFRVPSSSMEDAGQFRGKGRQCCCPESSIHVDGGGADSAGR